MSERRTDQAGRWLAFLLSLALVRGLLYAAIIPPWMAPDEPRHFEHVRLIYENGRLVSGSDLSLPIQRAIIASMDRFDFWRFGRFVNPRFRPGTLPQSFDDIWYPGEYNPDEPNMAHELHQPSLYYALGATVLYALPTDDVTMQLYVLRLLSVLICVVIVGLAYLVSRTLFPEEPALQLVVPSFVLFLPTYTFVSASVNNDRLAELAAALVISLLTLILARGARPATVASLVGALLLALLAKRSALFTWGVAVVAGFLWLWARSLRWDQWGRVVLVVVGVLVLGGLGWRLQGGPSGRFAGFFSRQVVRATSLDPGAMLADLQANPDRYFWRPFRSFWGRFGWENVGFPDPWFVVPALFVLVAGLGLIVLCRQALAGRSPYARWQWAAFCLFGVAIFLASVVNVVAVVAGNVGTQWVIFIPHGRYWFPVLIPIATLLSVGLMAWIPPRYRAAGARLMVLSMVAYDVAAMTLVIIPFFYG